MSRKDPGTIVRKDPDKKDVMSVAEVARRMDCCESTVREFIRRGTIPSIRVAEKRIVVPREAYDRMMKYGMAAFQPPPIVDLEVVAKKVQKGLIQAQIKALEIQLKSLEEDTAA